VRRSVAIAATVAACLLAPAPAQATFPGANGKIAFQSGGDIWTMNPDGSNQVNLTSDATAQGSPSWSPDGTRIAYDQGTQTFTMLADGTNRTLADDGFGNIRNRRDPAWSPDGTRVAFTNGAALFTMNPDGSGVFGVIAGANNDPDWSPAGDLIAYGDLGDPPHFCDFSRLQRVRFDGTDNQQLTDDMDCNYELAGSSWAPNAQRIGYYSVAGFCPPACADGGLFTIKPDGSDRQPVPGGGPNPAFSPDGTKIAYASDGFADGPIHTMNADGSGVSSTLAIGNEPDWQPIIGGYPRPKAATPFYVPLVPAETPCASPNRVHAAPLTYGACSPPSQTSGFATVGTPDANGPQAKSTGFVKLRWIGELPIDPNNGNQADIVIDAQVTDVRNKAGLADYTGGLRARITRQITDKQNTPYPGGGGPGTGTAAAFEFNLPCTTTADATVGSTCSVSTTANTLVPGQVLEQKRAVWELGRIELWDGGTDGNPSTAGDNTLFATQGVFIP
jgi:hypothetical protein